MHWKHKRSCKSLQKPLLLNRSLINLFKVVYLIDDHKTESWKTVCACEEEIRGKKHLLFFFFFLLFFFFYCFLAFLLVRSSFFPLYVFLIFWLFWLFNYFIFSAWLPSCLFLQLIFLSASFSPSICRLCTWCMFEREPQIQGGKEKFKKKEKIIIFHVRFVFLSVQLSVL